MIESNASQCYAFCSLFESEILLQMMMEKWHHPFANNEQFRGGLLESATELLMTAAEEGCAQVFIEGLSAKDMNFVAAIWYCEWCGVQDDSEAYELRRKWLEKVRRTLPSCFSSTHLLEP